MFPYKSRFYLVGIYSWGGKECNENSKPAVFADVRKAVDWISYISGVQTV